MASTSPSASYWCYQCTRFITVWPENSLICPYCDGGFIEAVEAMAFSPDPRQRFDSPRNSAGTGYRLRRRRRDRSPFNPVIVLRSPSVNQAGNEEEGGGGERSYELYYDDGVGSGLRPLPSTMSEFLMGSGFDRLLDQLSQIEITAWGGRHENPPASKSFIESMPRINIASSHVNSDSHCAVCKEAFALGSEALEMPCKHIYHSDCIIPWLSLRNSCPVCRHELPSETISENPGQPGNDESVGLTIWRLPGGGFAVGRFMGESRGGNGTSGNGQGTMPGVYTEIDGGFNNDDGMPRRIEWGVTRRGRRERGRISRLFANFSSVFRRFRSDSSSSGGVRVSRSWSLSGSGSSAFSRYVLRRNSNRNWVAGEDENGVARW
ncbi:probable E3 ubiquitin-protein ligase RHC2A [Olea europaea var. sylvestris]|uniref:probable E3 ubiquitin-protein ligase RHC2A n=1 Tax=Olea europaea var. sylvestris TaxID=158386 RepID=UPI000C1CFE05|nr:probable E3 ubiquitin-protein ligase RHC2A [Olea europaea var. sylvestris]